MRDLLIDPKGKFVLYEADQDTDEVQELYHYDLRSGAVAKVNPELVDGGDIVGKLADPTGRYVVYIADPDIDEVRELYRYDVVSGDVAKINPPFAAGRNESDVKFDAKGNFYFLSDHEDRRRLRALPPRCALRLPREAPSESRGGEEGQGVLDRDEVGGLPGAG